jgi:ectoine hydroxylase-related dioxygenase (phytanoyl-CoA dioxygenase family)
VPLDPVSLANGGVEYVRGSHRWGKRYEPQVFSRSSSHESTPSDNLESPPDVDSRRDEFDVAHFDTVPGDCILHHSLTLHGAPANTSTSIRRAIILRYLGDDVRYIGPRGSHVPPQPLEGVDATSGVANLDEDCRAHGGSFTENWYPLVWSTPSRPS